MLSILMMARRGQIILGSGVDEAEWPRIDFPAHPGRRIKISAMQVLGRVQGRPSSYGTAFLMA